MLVNFNSLPGTARIWIYQCNRSFTDAEVEEITQSLTLFLKNSIIKNLLYLKK